MRQAIHRSDDRTIVLSILAHRDQCGAVACAHELGRHDVAAAQRIDLAVHHRLRALALGELAGQGQIERSSRRPPHSSERLADGRGVEQPDDARLCEINP